ncbi:MAG: T9SS type A sorting domain-containing protein, partial [Caldisericaceae bacterium]|nr:T9SS type A sorting domain-containing protein [Caldisericaceae bacterium]
VQLVVYNLLGQKVKELVNKKQTAGYYKYPFDAAAFSSGIYFYVLNARGLQSNKQISLVKKMVVLK